MHFDILVYWLRYTALYMLCAANECVHSLHSINQSCHRVKSQYRQKVSQAKQVELKA